MKNIFLIQVLFLLVITACSKDDVSSTPTTDPTTAKYRLAEAKYNDGSTNKFEYNASGKLTKIFRNGNIYDTYTYDSQGRLIQIRYSARGGMNFELINYSYLGNSIQPNESIRRFQVVGDAGESRRKYVYTYSNNLLNNSVLSYWNPVNDTYQSPTTTTYVYDSNKRLVKETYYSGYNSYTYDTNGNRTEMNVFSFKSGSGTELYMRSSENNTFDNKKNLFANLYPNPIDENSIKPNNQLDLILKTFDQNGDTTFIGNSSTTYEYNEAGYPVKATTDGNVTYYVLEKISN